MARSVRHCHGQECEAILDTGSQVTTITSDYVARHPFLSKQDIKPTEIRIEGANGQELPHRGFISFNVEIEGIEVKSVPALVVPAIGKGGHISCLLGTDALRASRDRLHSKYGRDFMERVKSMSSACFNAFQALNCDGLDLADRSGDVGVARVKSRKPLLINPDEHVQITARAPRHTHSRSFMALVGECSESEGISVESAFTPVEDGDLKLVITNRLTQPVTLRKHQPIAKLEVGSLVLDSPWTAEASNNKSKDSTSPHTAANILHQDVSSLPPELDLPTEELTPPELDALQELLRRNADVFSQGLEDFGCTDTIVHEIPLIDLTPFRMPYRRIAPSDFKEVKNHLSELQSAGIIKPSKSPFASPIFIVRKKDGKIRLCVDYRKRNTRTTRDVFPQARPSFTPVST
ncbi:uncharacterized protein [Diadema antillarum]|uniref:uncharacterized protein n=1 Tax=Diadema antillarum TaxID=105358 RepID=UPI003A863BBA